MSQIACLSLLLLLLVSAAAQQQGDDSLARYKPGKLSQVVWAHTEDDPELEQSGIKLGSDPVRATVTYAGQSRPTPLAVRRFITSYVFQDGTPEDQSGLATELLFLEGKAEFWLPVQDRLVPQIKQELRRGDTVELYAVWVGATYPVGGRREQVFLVNEFRKPGAQQRARAAPAPWYTFRGPDGDFTVQFPEEPKREADVPGLIAAIRRYYANSITYYVGVEYEDVGPAASVLKPNHEATVSALLQEQGNRIVSVRRLAKDTSQIELWSPMRTPNSFLHRIDRTIVRNGRSYTLSCGSRLIGQEVNRAACRRFFDSFRIIGVPQ